MRSQTSDKHGRQRLVHNILDGIIYGFNKSVDAIEHSEDYIFSNLAILGAVAPAIGEEIAEDVSGPVGWAWKSLKMIRHNEGMFGVNDEAIRQRFEGPALKHANHDNYVGHEKTNDGQAISYMPVAWDIDGLSHSGNVDIRGDTQSVPYNSVNRAYMHTGHSQAFVM